MEECGYPLNHSCFYKLIQGEILEHMRNFAMQQIRAPALSSHNCTGSYGKKVLEASALCHLKQRTELHTYATCVHLVWKQSRSLILFFY